MSKEIKAKIGFLSISEEDVPKGKVLVGLYLPVEMCAELYLGTPVTLTLPEGGK